MLIDIYYEKVHSKPACSFLQLKCTKRTLPDRNGGALIAFTAMLHFNRVLAFVCLFEPRHEISNNLVYATNKGSDQPVYKLSLIRAFASGLNIV